jgi:hypothetical protein
MSEDERAEVFEVAYLVSLSQSLLRFIYRKRRPVQVQKNVPEAHR